MASIEKRGDSYRITVFLGRNGDHEIVRRRTTYTPELFTATGKKKKQTAIDKDVQKFASEFEKKVINGEYLDGEEISFDEYTKVWKREYAEINLTKRVEEDYCRQLTQRASPAFGHLPIARIKPDHIQQIVNKMQRPDPETGKVYAPKTIKSFYTAVRSVLLYAYRMEVIGSNPCDRVKLPTIKNLKEMQPFTEEEVRKFLEFIQSGEFQRKYTGGDRKKKSSGKIYHVSDYTETRKIHLVYQVLYTLALHTGLRRGELLALTWNDVDFDNRILSVTKAISKVNGAQIVKEPKTSAGKRDVDLDPSTILLLKRWYAEQETICQTLGSKWEGFRDDRFNENCIFINPLTGARMDIDTVQQKFRDLLTDYNRIHPEDPLPMIRFHDLRHTNATILLAKGIDVETVAKRLGHEKPSVTLDVYGHATKENGEKASLLLEDLFAVNK